MIIAIDGGLNTLLLGVEIVLVGKSSRSVISADVDVQVSSRLSKVSSSALAVSLLPSEVVFSPVRPALNSNLPPSSRLTIQVFSLACNRHACFSK